MLLRHIHSTLCDSCHIQCISLEDIQVFYCSKLNQKHRVSILFSLKNHDQFLSFYFEHRKLLKTRAREEI